MTSAQFAAIPVLFWVALGCLLAGLVIFIRGVRGRPRWSSPTCAVCKYDLRWIDPQSQRQCPECGADLQQPHAVRFGRHGRSRRLIALGIVLLLVPATLSGNALLQRALGFQWSQLRSNASLIAQLGTDLNNVELWNRLYERYDIGRIDDDDIAQVIDVVIANVQPAVWPTRPLALSERFVERAMIEGRIRDEQIARLCEAYYSTLLSASVPPRVRRGAEVDFSINGPQGDLPGLGHAFALREVTLGGRSVEPLPRQGFPRFNRAATGYFGLNGRLLVDGEVGDHEVQFIVELGVMDASFGGLMQPGLPEQWGQTRFRTTVTLTAPITILADDAQPIRLVAPEQHRQAVVDALRVAALRFGDMNTAELVMNPRRDPPVPLSFKISIRSGTFEQDFGHVTVKDGGYSMGNTMGFPRGLPVDATTVEVVFTPDPQAVETRQGWEEIWGDEIVVTDVPIRGRGVGGDAARQALLASMRINGVSLGHRVGNRNTAPRLQFIPMGNLPRNMTLDLSLRVGDVEYDFGTMEVAGNMLQSRFPSRPIEGIAEDVTAVDVIFRARPTGSDDDDAWREPIVVPNVPVFRDGPR